MRLALNIVRFAGFVAVVVGLLLRLLQVPGANETLLGGGSLVLLALIGNLLAGGWEMSKPDEKIRLAGHMLILYGFATYLQWFHGLPLGFQAVMSGLLLLLLATWLRHRRRRDEPAADIEDRIDEIGRDHQ